NATWKRSDEDSQEPPFVRYKAEGTLNWSASGLCSGAGTLPIQPDLSFLFTYNFIPSQGSLNRTYAGQTSDTRLGSVACPDIGSVPIALQPWVSFPPQPLLPGIPGARFVTVGSDGRLMKGSYSTIDGKQKWNWQFEAQRE